MTIYKNVSGADDVMTFCGEKISMTAARFYDYELRELYEFLKRLQRGFTTTNYANYTNYPMLIQWAPIRIIRS